MKAFWDRLSKSFSWDKFAGSLLLGLGAVLVTLWLDRTFIAAGRQPDSVRIREVIAVILVGALFMVIGVYLSMYRCRYELELQRTTRKAVADLIAKAYVTGKTPQELQTEVEQIRQRLESAEVHNLALCNLIATTSARSQKP